MALPRARLRATPHGWKAAAREGKVLVISGDYLKITSTGLNIDAAARLGTLVTANVSIPY